MGMIILFVVLALAVAGPIMASGFNKRQEEVNRRLVVFILENYEALAGGETLDYFGVPVSCNSRLVSYRYCYSYIVMTSSRSSAVFLEDDPAAHDAKVTCQVITAFSGWWGIPWGIIYSIQFLYKNGVRGGEDRGTVWELMQRAREAA